MQNTTTTAAATRPTTTTTTVVVTDGWWRLGLVVVGERRERQRLGETINRRDSGRRRSLQWRSSDGAVDRQQPTFSVQLHDGTSDGGKAFITSFVGRVHRQEAQNKKIHSGRDYRKADQDEEDAERDVVELTLVRVLQRHEVAEADGRQSDDAVIDRVQIGPALVPGERPGTESDHQRRHVHRYHN